MERMPGPMDADMRAFTRWIGSASPGARVFEADGIVAAIVPTVAERSVVNSVVYSDASALAAALPDLASAYEQAGVQAWTVWVPDGDREAARLLADAGHVLDGEPAAMVCDLAALDAPPPGDLDWTAEGDVCDLGAINDAAYPFPGAPFSRAIRAVDEAARIFVARHDGRSACALVVLQRDRSAGVYWVATLPGARGQGLATRLLGVALKTARERGCTVATLQASKMGAPVYERLGFATAGRLQMWERRSAGPTA